MTANVIAHRRVGPSPHGEEWIRMVCAAMKPLGVTYVRVSTPPDKPEEVWVEGWIIQPAEQEPEPWLSL